MSTELKNMIREALGSDAQPAAEPQPQPQPSADLASTIGKAISEGLAQALGQQKQAAPGFADLVRGQVQPAMRPPANQPGPPAPYAQFTEDTPLWRLSNEDREHLVRTKGKEWYRATLRKQMSGTRVKVRGF